MKILVTGGLGYIGSNMTLCLLKRRNKVIVIDNLSNSSKKVTYFWVAVFLIIE